MMELVLVGLSHKTAPVEIRERLAVADERLPGVLRILSSDFGFKEGMLLSTCNRVEVIARGTRGVDNLEQARAFLRQCFSLDPAIVENRVYSYSEREAVRHLFRVAASLDSMVVGEAQILGQVKEAYDQARATGTVGDLLGHLLPYAFFVAKRVRSETHLAESVVSVSSAAVELARKIFGQLSECRVLLLGAGRMAELAARSLVSSRAGAITVVNRTQERASEVAERLGAVAGLYSELDNYLDHTEVVLVSTGSSTHVLDFERVEQVVRRRRFRPLFIIDIAVPRNVDPKVNELENVFLYDIDDLDAVVSRNRQSREREAELAEEIVREEVDNFFYARASRSVAPLLKALRKRIEEICLEEVSKHPNGFAPIEQERIQRILLRTAHRVAHPLMQELKRPEEDPGRRFTKLELIRHAFEIEDAE